MESGVILGVARPEEVPDRHDAEPRDDLEQSQMQVDVTVVLNQSAELESSDSMAIDDAPAQQPSGQPVEAAQQSPATLTDTIVEVQKQLKRKRASNGPAIATADKDALVAGCRQELEGLFQYYKEVSGRKMRFEGGNLSGNAMVGCLLEESSLGLTKLVEEIHEKLKETEAVSVASVRSSVLLIGQRMVYGKSSPDADVLEDESESALWCWEIRDLKLMPVRTRGVLSTRRSVRKKIHDRITAIYSTLSVLENPGVEAQVNDLRKVSLKLNKSLNLEGIRSMVERVSQKNNIERGVKNARSIAKELMEETEKNDQNVSRLEDASVSELRMGNLPSNEKDIQKVQKQIEKEIKRQEKEEARMKKLQKKQQEEALREQKRREKDEAEAKKQQRRQEEEAQKEQKRREKEEAEMKKQQKRQQEEAEKEQKRREKEAAQLKKQLAIQKQASLMESFFKSKKDSGKLQKSGENDLGDDPCTDNKEVIPATTSKIDSSLSQQEEWVLEDLWRLQVTCWKKLSSYNRSSRWGIRRKPKMDAFKELKLQKSSDDMVDEILSTPNEDNCHNLSQENEHDKLESDIDMLPASHSTNNAKPLQTRLIRRKLLQFDKSNRPAYYGTWRKKIAVVGPRCPLKMDPDLDYEVDSDDEWEEEDPGESLSDCEKDSDEVMEEYSKITDEEDEDSFVVPDGYLSDNEGIQIESLLDDKDEEASSSPTGQSTEEEEFRFLLRQQKALNTLTEQALRKSQPLVISNINNEKAELLTAGDLKGLAKIEQLCLQVLSMCIYPGGAVVDVPVIDSSSANAEGINQSNVKISSPAAASAIPETDLPEIVQVIRSCQDGINKLVELLQQKFPNVSKSQLKSKVRDISDFVDNHWKVKKEVLDKLGLEPSPVKSKKTKGIAMYFSKRCLPPAEAINALASSPELRLKSKSIQNGNGGTEAPQINLFPSPQ
ncbi:chromatin assembly factor 1 subunit FSM-like [Phragmites australis]|uniref:chromatin assembly factor 1 subunit FSM-like n=1 Tax=Phragmites australis TaxID=29695 RepID=UPI002D796C5A|nr:chromatin assembly factor 1 subunit FSM-like [Phragmites australis]